MHESVVVRPTPDFDKRRHVVRVAILALAFFAVLYVRRSAQLVHPQVWDEDGAIILRELINVGPSSLVLPVEGYLVAIARLISFVAFSISPLHYPLLSTILAWLFTVAVLVCISVSPLVLRGGPLLALAALLVPSDPEVFGVPLYTFWWAGLLVLTAALWKRDSGSIGARVALVLIGGLSSPIVLLALPIFLWRGFAFRDGVGERAVGVAASLSAVAQLAVMLQTHAVAGKSLSSLGSVAYAVPKFLGMYLIRNLGFADGRSPSALIVASAVTLIVVAAAAWQTRRDSLTWLTVLYLWFGSMALSVARIDPAMIDPVVAGPRYFFYPYVLEGWVLVHIAVSTTKPALRWIAAALLLVAAADMLPVVNRPHDDLRWLTNVAVCAQGTPEGVFGIPIQSDGHVYSSWTLSLTGAQCRRMVDHDLLARAVPSLGAPMIPYVMHGSSVAIDASAPLAPVSSVVTDGWRGTDFQRTRERGLVVIGSFRSADADTGALTLRLRRGDRVLYRSGPVADRQRVTIKGDRGKIFASDLPAALEWALLEFANPCLPETFLVVFEDDGRNWGEWSAVGLSTQNEQGRPPSPP